MSPGSVIPTSLGAYLVRSSHYRYLALGRVRNAHRERYDKLSEDHCGERVVSVMCSEGALRMAAGPAREDESMSGALRRLSRELEAGLSDDEANIMV